MFRRKMYLTDLLTNLLRKIINLLFYNLIIISVYNDVSF